MGNHNPLGYRGLLTQGEVPIFVTILMSVDIARWPSMAKALGKLDAVETGMLGITIMIV